MNEKIKYLREKSMKLPLCPGVYIMKNKDKKIIYIGKAKALKNRVSQYFGSEKNHTTKVRKMVSNVDDFDYIICQSEFEALVLECSLIKQNMPKYNILLKDSKGYSYIKVTPGPWGNIFSSYRKDDKNATYIGPFTGNYSVVGAVDEAKEIFRLPTCNKVFPRDIKKSRPCLNYFIGKCLAPCSGKVTQEEYQSALNDAISFIKGGSKKTIDNLKKQMQERADALDFEGAAVLRDRISQINRLLKKQKVVLSESTDKDVINYALTNEKICFAVLQFSKGVLTGTDTFILDYTGELNEMFSEFLLSFYTQNHIPEKILFCEDFSFDEALGEYLSEQKGKRVALSNPKRGENLSLLEMTKQNAVQKLAYYIGQKGSQVRALEDLKDALNLKKIPNYIESYDISHTAGSDPVCSMVVFKNGVPFKKAYRTFLIKEAIGGDDLGSLKEAVKRRFNEYEKNKGSENTFAILPDLILLDGGQNQVNAVLPVIEEFNVDVPLFGIVKDSKHRTRAIQSTGSEISITDAKGDSRAMFSLVSEIGEEVHRFAISIHRKRHQKSQIQTVLTSINGIGEKKSKALINRFHSVKKISLASIEELASTDGISQKDATKIFEYFKTDT